MSQNFFQKSNLPQQFPHNNSQIDLSHGDSQLPSHKIRPIIEKTDKIYQYDKSSFRRQLTPLPPPESLFTSENNYDAGPHLIRTTSAVMMGNPKRRQFPYGAWITPFGCEKVHTVRVKSPLRCQRCRAYVNPHFRFDSTKGSAICNMCGTKFQIEETVDKTNINSSEIQTEGVIDFVVKEKKYVNKRTDIVKVVLAIETGLFIYESGILQTVIESVKSAIKNNEFGCKLKVGIVIFNNDGVQFMRLRKRWDQKRPLIYQVKYSRAGFCCPLSDEEMFFDPNTQKQKLLYLVDAVAGETLKYINQKYGSMSVNYVFLIKCLMEGFLNETGRIMLFVNSDPRSGLMAIRKRNEEQIRNMLKPLSEQYQNLGRELVKKRVGVDMYIFSKDSLINHQLSTTHYLSSIGGGNLYYYPFYTPEYHSENLYYRIYSALTKNYVYDINFVVRLSRSLSLCGYGVGEGYRESRDITLSMMNPESSVSVSFEHNQKIEENSFGHLQYAMIYTTSNGQRRVRVINYRYPIVNNIQQLYEGADYITFSNILCRSYLHQLKVKLAEKVRQQFLSRLRLILEECRSNVKNIHPGFVYIHSIINSKIFLNCAKSTPDIRITQILKVNSLNFGLFANEFYPKLYSISKDIYGGEIMPGDYIEGGEEQAVIIPSNIPLLKSSLSNNRVYLYCSSEEIVILVHNNVSSEFLYDLFGSSDWQQIQGKGLEEWQSSHNMRVNIIVEELRRRNISYGGMYLPVKVRTPVRKGPFNDLIDSVCRQDYAECSYDNLMGILNIK